MTTPAFIYRRFSTDEQEHGSSDTLARQLERCNAMAVANDWTVVSTMTDKGKSAFKGHHLLPDADLGGFMVRLRQGDIPAGAILIADNLSRLSRRPVDEAMAWIYEVNKAGVTIALADKNEIYTANPEIGDLITRAINLGVAYKSSEEKSKMTTLSKARLWKSAEARTGKWVNLANKLPSWLERTKALDGFVVDEERADVVRMIYQMSADGVGVNTITGHLNDKDIAPFAKAIKHLNVPHQWGRSGVRQLLISPNVEGDFRPATGAHKGRVIHGFYPRIVDADIVARARADLTARRKVAGKGAASGSNNLFAGITTCGECGRKAALSTSIQKGRPYAYVRCEAAGEKRCTNRNGYAYPAFENTVLDLMLDLALDDRFFAVTGELRDCRVRKAEIEKSLNDKRAQRARLMRAFAEQDGEDDQAMDMIRDLKDQIDTLTSELTKADEAVRQASGNVGNIEHLRRVGDIREAARSDDEATRIQARSKLRLAMTSIIMSVDIEHDQDGVKIFTVILKGGIMAVRINTKGKVMGIVSKTGDDPLWKHIANDHQQLLAPLIARIEKLAA